MTVKQPKASSGRNRGQGALMIAAKGKPVFPCKPDKSPYTPRGYKDATTNPGRVSAFFTKHLDALIGMPTGSLSDVDVVDVDRIEALEDLEAELVEYLWGTLVVRTPSGGIHFYLKHSEGITNRTGTLPDGIDIRGEGGYVIVPPSRGYRVEKRSPIKPAPALLVEKLREKKANNNGTRSSNQASTVDVDDTSPIPEGRRNQTLTSIGGRLRGFGFGRAEIEDALLRTNAERCSPTLPEDEVRRIAASVARYEPGKGTPPPDAATLARLDAIEADLLTAPWPKVGGKSERSAAVVALKLGRRVGRILPDGRVEISVSRRALALAAATSRKTIDAILKRSTWLAPGRPGSGTSSGTIILTTPWGGGSAKGSHSNLGVVSSSGDVASGEGLRAPFSAPRLRWSAPEILRLGKSAEAAIDFLEQLGGSAAITDLAELLHVSRVRDFRRRVIGRLEERGIVTVFGETVALVEDWLEALNVEREVSGEIAAYRRDMERYNREREGYRSRHQNMPDRAPSEEEMAEYQAARPPLVGDAIRAHAAIMNPNTNPGRVYATSYGSDLDTMACAVAAHFGESRGDPRAWKRWLDPVAQALAAMDGDPRVDHREMVVV
jgi:hypothetical protein